MVALHNRKLSYRDVFPGNLWTWEQINAKKKEFLDQRLANGESNLAAMVNASEDFRVYLAAQATMRTMQQTFKQLYPPQSTPSSSDRMKAALEAIRDGHNDARGLAAEVLSDLFD